MTTNADYNRLYWHSRRGMLELDLILMPFVEKHFKTLPDEDKDRYVRLLECEDQDMFSWFMQHSKPDNPDMAKIVELILDRHLQS